jgi:hypothetical protein
MNSWSSRGRSTRGANAVAAVAKESFTYSVGQFSFPVGLRQKKYAQAGLVRANDKSQHHRYLDPRLLSLNNYRTQSVIAQKHRRGRLKIRAAIIAPH